MSRDMHVASKSVESLTERRSRLFTSLAWSTLVVAAAAFGLFILWAGFEASASTPALIPIAGMLIALTLCCLWLDRHKRTTWAIFVYLSGVSAAVLGVMHFALGVSGPPTVILIAVPVVAALLGGRRFGQVWAAIVGVLYLSLLSLELSGILTSATMSGTPVKVMSGAIVVLALALLSYVVGTFIDQGEAVLAAAREQGRELERLSREAELAAAAERELREREAASMIGLRQIVREYIDFLQRVSAGDYAARVVVDAEETQDEGLRELRLLAVYLNATVESLVLTLEDMQVIQRRYLGEAWREFTENTQEEVVLTYSGESAMLESEIAPENGLSGAEWDDLVDKSLQLGGPQAKEELLALPIIWSGQMVGVIGCRRTNGATWRQEEITVAQAVIDQLAQTIENLRLVDQTQLTAQRERMAGQISARIRTSLDVETMLRTAVDEMQRSLGLDRVAVHLITADKAIAAHVSES